MYVVWFCLGVWCGVSLVVILAACVESGRHSRAEERYYGD